MFTPLGSTRQSPTCALALAVDSLIQALDGSEPFAAADRKEAVETLHGMRHTITALSMITNRYSDYSKYAMGHQDLCPRQMHVDLPSLMARVSEFTKWQAEGTGIQVTSLMTLRHFCYLLHSLLTYSTP